MVDNSLWSIVVIFLLCGCNAQEADSSHALSKNIVEAMSNSWINDKDGCLKLRNVELAHKLINENNLKNKTKALFIKVFGTPNEIDSISNKRILIYYFDGVERGHGVLLCVC